MTLKELRVCMMGGASHCSQQEFAAMARLAEERLLLEHSINIGGCTTLFWDGGSQWWVDDINGEQHLAPTLSEAIRKAAGVSR